MIYPPRLSRSLGLLWHYAGRELGRVMAELGLGILPVRAVLPRSVLRALACELVRLETIVRRVLFLAAMETPLPRAGKPARGPGVAAAGSPPPDVEQTAMFRTPPVFRLFERHDTSRPQAPPRPETASMLPEAGAESDEAAERAQPWHLLPAGRLMRRLAALKSALAEPEPLVARFRARLARVRADRSLPLPVSAELPKACTTEDVWPNMREAFRNLHFAAILWLYRLDSS